MPDDAYKHQSQGNAFYKKGRYDKAIPEFMKAIKLKPDLVQSHNNLGFSYYNKDRFEEAIAEFKKATEINPKLKLGEALALGTLYLKKREVNKALYHYRKYLELAPADEPLRANVESFIREIESGD